MGGWGGVITSCGVRCIESCGNLEDKKIEPRPGTEGLTSLSRAGSSATCSLKGQKASTTYRSAVTSVELIRRSMAETALEADRPFESAPLETLKSTIDKNLKESLLLA